MVQAISELDATPIGQIVESFGTAFGKCPTPEAREIDPL